MPLAQSASEEKTSNKTVITLVPIATLYNKSKTEEHLSVAFNAVNSSLLRHSRIDAVNENKAMQQKRGRLVRYTLGN